MANELGYHTVKNIGLGFALGIILCVITLSVEAAFSVQEMAMLF